MRSLPLLLLLSASVLTSGCAHRVQILSTPTGASVSQDAVRVGSAPEEITVRMLQQTRVSISLPGYRTLTFRPDLRARFWDFVWEAVTFRWKKATGRVSYGSMEVILIPDHPTYSGQTLTEEDP